MNNKMPKKPSDSTFGPVKFQDGIVAPKLEKPSPRPSIGMTIPKPIPILPSPQPKGVKKD